MTPKQVERFFLELKRRNVIRVGLLYCVVAWLLLQLADVGISALGLPQWTGRFVLLLLGLGLPVALVFAWVFELTPEGLRLESNIDPAEPIAAHTGARLNVVIAVLLVVAIAVMLIDMFVGRDRASPPQPTLPAALEHPSSLATGPQPLAVHEASVSRSIAVLPFADMSPARDKDYFSDGLTEELLNALVKIRDLRVVGRTSSFAYKGMDRDLRVVGQELGVDHLLEGSVRMAGSRLRITAQLVSAADGYHLWSETYDRELTDIFDIQADIAAHVVEALELKLLGGDAARMTAGGTNDVDAYNDYLRGIYLINMGSREDTLREAIAALDAAVARDPAFADAWVALGKALGAMIANGWGVISDSWARVEVAARMAREHAPDIAGGHVLESYLLGFRDFRWAEAAGRLQRAIQLEPGNAAVVFDYAFMVRNFYPDDEALAAGQRAVRLEPANLWHQVVLGTIHILAGQCPEAEVLFRGVIARDPEFPRPRYYLGLCRYLAGDYGAALELFEAEPLPWMRLTGRPLALQRLGRLEEAEAAYEELRSQYADGAAYQLAQVAAQWGDAERAFEWLEHAVATRDAGVTSLLKDPLMEPLHGDPRYRAALDRAGLLPFAGTH